jgi:hypothetical protein
MELMKRAVLVVMVLCGLLVNLAFAQKPAVVVSKDPGWHKIGEVTASFKMENESISVLGADEFAAIKLRVTDAPINISRVQVFYEDGQMEDIDVKNDLSAGSETRILDLAGSNRELSKVVFTYKTMPNRADDKAHVELYGYKTQRDGQSDAYRDDKDTKVENEAERVEERTESATEETKEEMNEDAREAQHDANVAEDKAEQKADNVGDDISNAAGNVGAEIKDKPYVDKVGPNGERIYMDRHSKYYYINSEGKKVFITKLEMKDNPKKDK